MIETRLSRKRWAVLAGIGLSLYAIFGITMPSAEAKEKPAPRISPRQLRTGVDVSPLPNYKGAFVSMGLDGAWQKPDGAPSFIGAAAAASQEPAANCSRDAIIYYASMAPGVFEADKKGLLYGVETHTAATRVANIPGFNSCALVVHAILKRAGCGWAKYTADAKAVFDMAAAKGWRRAASQEGGCIVAWNSRFEGKRARIGPDAERRGGVLFRHVGLTTGGWMSVDNTAVLSRPSAFFTWRPYRYESPIFICPPPSAEPKAQ